jgi:hypothetical protein
MPRLDRYAKAIAAAVTTFGAGYTSAILDGSPGQTGVTSAEWQHAAITAVIAGILVWAIPNSDPHDDADQDDGGGHRAT